MPIDLVAVNLYPFQTTIAQPRRLLRGRHREHRHRRPVDAPLRGQEPRVRPAGGGSDRLPQGARHAPARRRSRRGAARPRRQGVRPHRRLRRRHRRLPDAAGGRAAAHGSASRWSGCRRCATARTPRSAPRSTSPRSRAACGTSSSGRARSSRSTTCSTSTPRWPRWPAGATGRPAASSSTPRPAASRSAGSAVEAFRKARATDPRLGLRLGGRVQHRGGSRHRRGDERPLRRGGRGARRSTRRRSRSSPRRRTSGWWSSRSSRGDRHARLQAGARRLPGAGPVRVRSVGGRLDGRHRPPADRAEWNDLRFAWAAVASVKSNAILLARDEMAIGIGAGQMSRVDAAFLAVHKARQQGHDPARQRPRLATASSPSPTASSRRRQPASRADHPARRLGAGRGGDRGGQPARHRHGDDRPPRVPTLADEPMTATPQERPPYLWALATVRPSSS